MATAQQDEAAYAKRYAKLYKAYVDEPTNVATLHELALFYADSLNPMCDYAEAMRYVCAAEQHYLDIVHERSKYKEVSALIKKKVTVALVRESKERIVVAARKALTEAEVDATLNEQTLDALADAFSNDAEMMSLIGKRRLEVRYRDARSKNDMETYRAFIRDYPGTSESETAEVALGQLALDHTANARREGEVDTLLNGYMEIAAVRRVAAKRKSAIAYANLMKQPSPTGYRTFLSKYPGSDEYSDVLERLENLEEMNFEQLRTPRQYADFVHRYPDNPLAEKAMERIKQMIRDERDPQALAIYMQEFPLDVNYNDIYLLYYKWHTEEGNASPLRAFAEKNPDYPYTVALDEDLANAERYDQIALNEPFVEKDIRAWASKIYHLTGKRGSYVALQRTMQHYIATQEWDKIPLRIDYFALSFEDYCQAEVAELHDITQAPVHPQRAATSVVCPVYDMRHPILYGADELYYDKEVEGVSTIQMARLTAGRRGNVWRGQGPVRFVNMDNSGLHIYNFYDNGRRMLLGRDGNIMTAVRVDSMWRVEETLPAPVNSAYEDYDAFMLPDGSGLLFASDRPGGHNLQPSRSYFHGDTALASDIWFVAHSDKGWDSVAICLGIGVNSECMECSPLLSNDKKTIYYITDRRGLGYGDIYYASRDNVDDWYHWSAPHNAGKEVNSGYDEHSVTQSYDGSKLIFSSNSRGRYGCYSVSSAQVGHDVVVPVTVASTGVGIALDVIDQQMQRYVNRNERLETGSQWTSSFMADKNYLLLGRCDGLYVPAMQFSPAKNRRLQLQAYDAASLVERDGEELPLVAVLFEKNLSDMQPSARAEMDHLADFMMRHRDLRVELTVDEAGQDDTYSFNLSQSRGQMLKKYLVSKGVEADRVAVSTYGNSRVKRQERKAGVGLLVYRQ